MNTKRIQILVFGFALGILNTLVLAGPRREPSNQPLSVFDIIDVARVSVSSEQAARRLAAYVGLQRTRRELNIAKASLLLATRKPKPSKSADLTYVVSLDNLLFGTNRFSSQTDIPIQLQEHVKNAVTLVRESPELGFTLAASLCDKWAGAAQSEYIFSMLIETCMELSRGRGLEVTIIMFRSFVQRLKNQNLRERANLRIGRIYYEHGDFGKAVVELDIDTNVQNPSAGYSLAGLIKAMALIRLGQVDQALSLLEWIAMHSPDTRQQGRAAFLLGRINLLYRKDDQARKWLEKVAYELADLTHVAQARALLSQMQENLE